MAEVNQRSEATIKLLEEVGIDGDILRRATNTERHGIPKVNARLWGVRATIYEIISKSRSSTAHDAWILAYTLGLAEGYPYSPEQLTSSRYNTSSNLTPEDVIKSREASMQKLKYHSNKEKLKRVLVKGREYVGKSRRRR